MMASCCDEEHYWQQLKSVTVLISSII